MHGSSRGGGTRRNRPTTPIFSISQGQVSLPQSARRPVPPHRLVATLPQPSCIYFVSVVCDRPNAASGLRRVQALGELARAWFVHILRASSIARFRATEPARSSKSKSPGQSVAIRPVNPYNLKPIHSANGSPAFHPFPSQNTISCMLREVVGEGCRGGQRPGCISRI